MKKIGILTYFWADNPGTFLQAYSTYRAFKSIFPNDRIELIDYKQRFVYYKPGFNHIFTRNILDGYRKHVLFKKLIDTNLPKSRTHIVSRDRKIAAEFIRRQEYDLIVVGSDTVLQFLPFHFEKKNVPIYWLPSDIFCRKVLCAASSSALSIEELSPSQAAECKDSIERFDAIGVRDDATYRLIESLNIENKSRLTIIPDPTFAFDIDLSIVDKFLARIGLDPTQKSVLLDLPRAFTRARDIATYFRSKGYRILSLVPADYADVCLINISPFEWAGIYRYCALVITQRFHGTIFSLKNLVPVITVVWTNKLKTLQGLSKHLSLLKLFNLHDSNYIDGVELEDVRLLLEKAERATTEFDKILIEKRLSELKSDYLKFIASVKDLLHPKIRAGS